MSLDQKRKWYAQEIKWNGSLTNELIVEAFGAVPRERFLGKGPWKIKPATLGGGYRSTPDGNPEHLYHNVLVAIDSGRGLNNGLPSWIAEVMQHGSPNRGDAVAHIGVGVGYYTAIFAHIVGGNGAVLGLEIDGELAHRAEKNLQEYPGVNIVTADGSSYDFEQKSLDLLFINAGATDLKLSWVGALKEGGRMTLPMTFARDREGQILKLTLINGRYRAEFVQGVYVYHCIGAQDDESAGLLRRAVEEYGWELDGELRLDPENADESAWLVAPDYWISRRTIA